MLPAVRRHPKEGLCDDCWARTATHVHAGAELSMAAQNGPCRGDGRRWERQPPGSAWQHGASSRSLRRTLLHYFSDM